MKYWLQVELGRFCIASNLTTIEALNTLPGPRWRGTHLIPLLYMFGFVLSMATLLVVGIVMLAFRTERSLRMGPSAAVFLVISAVILMVVLVRTAPDSFASLGQVLRQLR